MVATGRRRWLAALIPTAVDAVADAVEQRVTLHRRRRRPPGAVAEGRFLQLCTRCDACVDACPHRAVHRYVESAGEVARTPVMRPDLAACHMCEGFPCATACETGALVPPTASVWDLGTVEVDPERCFTFRGPECGACAGVCPDGVRGLVMRGVHPAIDEGECVGCGLCVEACPTTPKAIGVQPLDP